ncbi:zinc carboxypeptidase family protein [Cryptosporidium muris RN66]|uniref:Zinc carboxypeptidase family protein n=1 Tax=Cryptosporidium muris (strain RN66) TaxID=441375 RepID=B6AFX8_CRYMR|nr:zinc carboxypeptidase family protein [Cryptosporidium muris RN66]EEA07119.1 zinc carboxypeptidase family protein [Cryptosporidium muris RN66]|eukprot:XP_002141468.1 zinc carboxypeptidase family protein [Cryptosporidium muris RN66]
MFIIGVKYTILAIIYSTLLKNPRISVFGRLERDGVRSLFHDISYSPIISDYNFLKAEDNLVNEKQKIWKTWLDPLHKGSLKGFPTFLEALDILNNFQNKFGNNYIRRKSIGISVEGRSIDAFIIGIFNSTDIPNNIPSVLVTSMHHSREPESLVTGIYFIGRLLEEAVKLKDLTSLALLSSTIIWYIPFVNPDGYVAIERTKAYGIRKNQRNTCNSYNPLYKGVDINRNYDFMFKNVVSECDPQEYSGPYPFSEPETRAIRNLIRKFKTFKTAINLHTYGDLWTIPWNCCKDMPMAKNFSDIYNELRYEILLTSPSCIFRVINTIDRQKLESLNYKKYSVSLFLNMSKSFEDISRYCFSSAPNNPYIMYEASGEADDYLLGIENVISLSPEIGPEEFGFYPPLNQIIPIAQRYYPQLFAVAFKASTEYSLNSSLKLIESGNFNNTQGTLELNIFNSGLSSGCIDNKTCEMFVAWSVVTSNCLVDNEYLPGQMTLGNYIAGFRYRNVLNTYKPLCNNKNVHITQLSITPQVNILKSLRNNIFSYSPSVGSRSTVSFQILVDIKSSFDVITKNSYLKACILVNQYSINSEPICHCGFAAIYNETSDNFVSKMALVPDSNELCKSILQIATINLQLLQTTEPEVITTPVETITFEKAINSHFYRYIYLLILSLGASLLSLTIQMIRKSFPKSNNDMISDINPNIGESSVEAKSKTIVELTMVNVVDNFHTSMKCDNLKIVLEPTDIENLPTEVKNSDK